MVQKDTKTSDTEPEGAAKDRPVLIQITVPDQTVAKAIATALVDRRLAAAVHLAEIASVYRWQGAVQRGPEIVLTVKSLAARFSAIQTLVDELHPYELPPLLQIDIAQTSPEYAHWIAENADG